MITLHGASASPFVRKVMVVLAVKELPYEHIPAMPWSNDAALKKVSPLEKVPALQDGDLTIADSKVICRYLDNAYPEVAVYPRDPAGRAKADWFEEYGGTALAESAGAIFFHRFMRPMVFKQEVDEDAVTKITEKKLPPLLEYLESQLPAQGFLFDSFGVADMAVVSPLINAGYAGYAVDSERWPKLAAFAERVKTHNAVEPLLAAEAKAFGL
ncbi:MAG: glutathione S-transferase [Hyphomicrobiaceae bacterium]|jgi:glutathione S-transferase